MRGEAHRRQRKFRSGFPREQSAAWEMFKVGPSRPSLQHEDDRRHRDDDHGFCGRSSFRWRNRVGIRTTTGAPVLASSTGNARHSENSAYARISVDHNPRNSLMFFFIRAFFVHGRPHPWDRRDPRQQQARIAPRSATQALRAISDEDEAIVEATCGNMAIGRSARARARRRDADPARHDLRPASVAGSSTI